MFEWLTGGNDRQLAATTYEGRESATDRKARKDREARNKRDLKDGQQRVKAANKADRAGRRTHAAGEHRRFGGR
ncbi:hypothetical protein [Kitasatospora sp. NPDC058046]|uniref:hypothetical protein n=1 Tax=Kitasatospora sp. NPDC058046 TaxID=3346312 RepID=UPI0036DBEBC2